LNDALIIPQKATFEVLDKKFVFIVEEDGTIRSKEIVVKAEMDHLYVVEKGLKLEDRILIEGLRKVQDGDIIEYDVKSAQEVYGHLKLHAE
jgi:membrane fusion protein (multidrug efflux system)